MVSVSTADILVVQTWLKPVVSTMLPNWVLDLLPLDPEKRRCLIKSAALLGTTFADRVMIGQVSHVRQASVIAFTIRTPQVAKAMHQFGRDCCMTSKASILRTAIMFGLGIPGIETGVMSKTTDKKLTENEIYKILSEAKRLFPKEPI